MYKCKNENAKKLMAEIESGWMDSFMIDNRFLPSELSDKRKKETAVSSILPKLEIAEKINHVKKRKTELLAIYAKGEIPTLTIEEESRVARNEEAFYELLVKWGVCEEITEDDLLDL
jgi:hypothetical protein